MSDTATDPGFQRAIITGVRGQDGAWLAANLLARGVHVIGTHRSNNANTDTSSGWRLDELAITRHPHLQLHALDVGDPDACCNLVSASNPEVLFHFAGQSAVAESFRDPLETINANGNATLHLLEALRVGAPTAHFVLAASAEMFAPSNGAPQDETAELNAASPYALSKLLAHAGVQVWRQSFGMRASSAILFNHESKLRGEAFVTRKISRGVARIRLGYQSVITLGNLDAQRDFGYAPEFVAAMASIAARAHGDDFVLATGNATSVREFAQAAFAAADIDLDWHGHGLDEIAIDRASGALRVHIDPILFRPIDSPARIGNPAKARRDLDFAPCSDVALLAWRMVHADLDREQRLATPT